MTAYLAWKKSLPLTSPLLESLLLHVPWGSVLVAQSHVAVES